MAPRISLRGTAGKLLGEGRSDHHAVELADHLLAHLGAAEPPGRDIGHFQFGAEHDRRQRRQECQHGAGFDQARAKRIDDDDLVVTHGLQQSGGAEPRRGVEFERIDEIGIDAPQQHFGAAQPRDGANKYAIVLDDEILAFDQQESEIACEIGVLEIGFVHRARRQQRDAGVVAAVEREQFGLQRLKKRRNTLDTRGPINIGNGARQGEPVFDRIAGAGRRLRPIVQHPPASVGTASDIDRIETQMRAARRFDADQWPQEFRIAGNQCCRQPAVTRERAGPIAIFQHRFEQFGALNKAGLQLPPFAGFDEQRDMAQRPRPFDAGRILVDAIKHAGITQVAVGGGEAAIDLIAAERGKHAEERLPMRAHPAVAIHHLVENAGERPVARDERLQRGV